MTAESHAAATGCLGCRADVADTNFTSNYAYQYGGGLLTTDGAAGAFAGCRCGLPPCLDRWAACQSALDGCCSAAWEGSVGRGGRSRCVP